MAANAYMPHTVILTEDEALHTLAVGLKLNTRINQRQVDIKPWVGGWKKINASIKDLDLAKYTQRSVIVLIDFDQQDYSNRIKSVLDGVDVELHDRIYILGAKNEVERLKGIFNTSSLEVVGKTISNDCSNGLKSAYWENEEQLSLNKDVLDNLCSKIGSILFKP